MYSEGHGEQEWQQSLQKAQSCLQQQDFPGAIDAARESLQLKPDQALSLGILASCLKEQGDYLAALDSIDQARSLEPDNDIYLRIKVEICLTQGDLDTAQGLIEQLIDHSPNDLAARECLGDVFQARKQYEEAMSVYLDLPKSASLNPKIFASLVHLKVVSYHPRVERLAVDYLSDDQNNPDDLAELICDLLAHKYMSRDDIDLSILAKDPLLLSSLSKFVFPLHSLEPLLLNLRAGLLQTCLGQLCVPDDLEALCCALALQCFSNEYCWYINEDEQTLLVGLEVLYGQTMEAGIEQPGEISAIVLLLALYNPIMNLSHEKQLAAMPLMEWPEPMRKLIQIGLLDILEEREISAAIPLVTDTRNAISLQVQAQYEEHPFPRWSSLDRTDRSIPYVKLYDYLQIRPEDFFPGETLQILVAGCGTGKLANYLASAAENSQITAIDLSSASLAYGKRMAQRHGLNNVEFIQGDILELGSLETRFHVIDCSGVMHHLQDPMAGLDVLVSLLKPGGLVNMGLYSVVARETVTRLRSLNERINVQPTSDSVRALRHQFICGEVESEFEPIPKLHDLHTMSSCRDLLFQVQEHHFTLPRIKEMLQQRSLVLRGFNPIDAETRYRYLALFPHDTDYLNLDHWHQLEQQYPATFTKMYQFHCQLDDSCSPDDTDIAQEADS